MIKNIKEFIIRNLQYIEPMSDLRRKHNIASIGAVNYWAIPKAGNTSVKIFLAEYYGKLDENYPRNDTNSFIHKDIGFFEYIDPQLALSNGKINFTFIRDPYDRVKSFYFDFCQRRKNPALAEFFGIDFDDCLDLIRDQMAMKSASFLNPHIRPQSSFLKDFQGYKFDISDFDYKHENQSKSASVISLSSKQRELIGELYKEDVKLYSNFANIEKLPFIL